MISVLILTLNEEVNLPACLRAAEWSDDIVVFDSFSTDRTVDIARAFGARVIQRRFDDENRHRTASLSVGFKYPWVFNPDADEIATPELSAEMHDFVASHGHEFAACRMRRKDMFMGRWLRYSSLYPTWLVRLFRPDHLSFEREINLSYLVRGREAKLENHLLHYSFNKGLEAWFEKHNRYSTAEALETVRSLGTARPPLGQLLSREPVARRRALKELSVRMPGRPTLRFLYMYLLCRGFLDGGAGYQYCKLLSAYERMICLKVDEIRRREQGLTV